MESSRVSNILKLPNIYVLAKIIIYANDAVSIYEILSRLSMKTR